MRWILAILWGLLLAFAAWGLAVGFMLATPQELAALMGFAGFMLLGSRLVWGYGALLAFVEALHQGEAPDRSAAEAAVRAPQAAELPAEALAGFWLAALEPYRYAFFAVYALLLLIVLALKLAVPLGSVWGWITGGSLIEGVFWGASVAALIVWALSAAAAARLLELSLRNTAASA
ncbi:MAG TPA: hypothetical protein ENK37_09660 [Oceanithermus profundus]|uniref:Uncharacterized protein n=1 Tax=Oceanithermus profundus TaxID=187137 RepID=A0A7C4Z6U3_9DEIN|nr:hypothetical protein [Oceanithermus profundus]